VWSELAGWAVALAVSLGVVAVVATVSDWLLYTDGDSVAVAMIARSFALGQPQDWAMSPVLFIPETVVYVALSLLGLGMRATLTLNAVVNLLALYGAIRLVAGRRREGRTPVTGAVLAFAAFGLLAVLEGAASAPGFQLASLQATTTYYSATVVAAVAVIGLIRRVLDGAGGGGPVVAIAVIAAVSMLTNPLFAVWAAGPAIGMLALLAFTRRVPVRVAAVPAAALGAGAVVGYAARTFFGDTIVAAGNNYFRADRWTASLDYFGGMFGATAGTWHGMLWLVVVAGLWIGAGIVAVRAWQERDSARFLVGAVAAATPVLVTLGAIAIGSDADRYLQPWVFLPVLALAVVPWRRPRFERGARLVAAAGLGILVALAVIVAVPRVVDAATRGDADLACVVDWVDGSGRTGAGQFWTVRAPKAHLDDPARLIQVDHTMRVYTWLTNRTDAEHANVTFLVKDAATYPFVLPEGFAVEQADVVPCGRYSILDFGDRVIPLGPPRD
jgi:hypothetical protein